MFELPPQSKILIIYDNKKSKFKNPISDLSNFFPNKSTIYKNINVLSDKENLCSNLRKRKCKFCLNYFFTKEKEYLNFIRFFDDKIEFIETEILIANKFLKNGLLIGSKNLFFFKKLSNQMRSFFTDLFYEPSNFIDIDSIKNVIFIENENQNIFFNVQKISDFTEIGPNFKLKIIDEYLIEYKNEIKKKQKNLKITNQRTSGRVYVNKQDLKGLRLKKGIFKE